MPTQRTAAAPLDEPAIRVLRQFRLVFNTVKAHFREVEKRAGIAGAQVWALSVVREQPGIGVSGLARAMDIHQSTASNLLKPLLEQGLVAADRAADKRALHLRISPAGTRVLRKAPMPLTGVLPRALGQLDTRTLARLERDLDALVAVLGHANARASRVPLGQDEAAPARRTRAT
jgi:DNA-binding MarR family transcriptional regulator